MTALNLYKKVLITYTLYGCEVWLNLKLSDVDHLNEFQHFVLKHITCLPKNTRSDSVESVCDLLPLSVEVYRRKLISFGKLCNKTRMVLRNRFFYIDFMIFLNVTFYDKHSSDCFDSSEVQPIVLVTDLNIYWIFSRPNTLENHNKTGKKFY